MSNPVGMVYMYQPFRLDFVWAGLCWSARCTSSFAPEGSLAVKGAAERSRKGRRYTRASSS